MPAPTSPKTPRLNRSKLAGEPPSPRPRGRPSKGDRTAVLLRLPSSLHQEFMALLHEADVSLSDVVGALVANLAREQPSPKRLRTLVAKALPPPEGSSQD
jgi:hypothetical protein